PIEPLLEVIARPVWNSRQKGAQALAMALRPAVWAGREERIARALLPLLASQRSRGYTAAARCLCTLSGVDLGTDPYAGRAWYCARCGRGIDLLAGVHEVVLVIERQADGSFAVQGERAADDAALTAAVRAARLRAERGGLTAGAVVRATDDAIAK